MEFEVLERGLCGFYTKGLKEKIGYELLAEFNFLTAKVAGKRLSTDIFNAVYEKIKDKEVYPSMFVDGIELPPSPNGEPMPMIKCILEDTALIDGVKALKVVYSFDRSSLKSFKFDVIKNEDPVFYFTEGLSEKTIFEVDLPYPLEEDEGFYILNQFCMELLKYGVPIKVDKLLIGDGREIHFKIEKSKHRDEFVYMIHLDEKK